MKRSAAKCVLEGRKIVNVKGHDHCHPCRLEQLGKVAGRHGVIGFCLPILARIGEVGRNRSDARCAVFVAGRQKEQQAQCFVVCRCVRITVQGM